MNSQCFCRRTGLYPLGFVGGLMVGVMIVIIGCAPPLPLDRGGANTGGGLQMDLTTGAGMIDFFDPAMGRVPEPFEAGDAAFCSEVARQEVAVRVLVAYLDSQPVRYELGWKPRRLTASQQALMPGRTLRDLAMLKIRHKAGGGTVELSTEALEAIANLPRLERLYLERSNLDDDGCLRLARVKTLRRLAIWGSKVTDSGIARLVALPELESLDVHETKITPQAFASFVQMPKLQFLRTNKHDVRPSGPMLRYIVRRLDLFCPDGRLELRSHELRLGELTFLEGVAGIHTLVLDGNLPDGGLRYVATMPELETLILLRSNLPAEDYAYLSQEPLNPARSLAPITSLGLSSMHLPEEALHHIARMPHLRSISLKGCMMSHESLGCLADTRVEAVHGVPVEALRYLAGSQSIRQLSIAQGPPRTPFDSTILGYLRDLPNLEALNVRLLRSAVGNPAYPGTAPPRETVDTVLNHVLVCSRLRALAIDRWEIDDRFLKELPKRMPRLEYLSVTAGPGVTADGLLELKELPLKDLAIGFQGPSSPSQLLRLQAAMPDCRTHPLTASARLWEEAAERILREGRAER